MAKPLSPCVHVCVIDPATRLCEGCGRSLDEIADWGAIPAPRRRALMRLLGGRLRGLRAERAARVAASLGRG